MNEEGQIRQMIKITATMLSEMGSRWYEASFEDKHAFAHTLFSEIIFDMDTHQITGFALKAWAAQFLQISAAHYAEQNGAVMWLEGYKPIGIPFPIGRYPAVYQNGLGVHLRAGSSKSTSSQQIAA